MGKKRDVYEVLVGKPRGGDHLEDTRVGGRTILKKDLHEVGWGGAWPG
jgi:hypothetical protein